MHCFDAIYYYQIPKKLSEHVKQSKKFLLLPYELKKYIGIDITKDHQVPAGLKRSATISALLRKPIQFSLYFIILLYSRFLTKNTYLDSLGYWDTDVSTKEVNS